MAQQYIFLGQNGESALTVINDNFTELYATLNPNAPIIINSMSHNTAVNFSAGFYLSQIFITNQAGNITLSIGTIPGGGEILDAYEIASFFTPILPSQYFQNSGTLYFTIDGGMGVLNIYIFYLNGIV